MTEPSDAARRDHPFLERLTEAAREAERETGRTEVTDDEVRRSLAWRGVRAVAGVVLLIVGIAALPLPGPGWLIIILGLTLLPFAWAERTVRLIRRKIPGVPEEGAIPASTWITMIGGVAAFTTISLVWGDDITNWVRDLF